MDEHESDSGSEHDENFIFGTTEYLWTLKEANKRVKLIAKYFFELEEDELELQEDNTLMFAGDELPE